MMKNIMGDLRPRNQCEIEEAIQHAEEHFDVGASGMEAEISHDAWQDTPETQINMTGYTAEVRDKHSGLEMFTTQGFRDRESLVAVLHRCGITDVVDA